MFSALHLLPSDMQRERMRRAGMAGLRHKQRHEFCPRPRLATRQPGQRGPPAKFVAHFPSPGLSLATKVCSYLLPLPYRPPGERSISSFLRWCKPSRPISPLRSRDARFRNRCGVGQVPPVSHGVGAFGSSFKTLAMFLEATSPRAAVNAPDAFLVAGFQVISIDFITMSAPST